MPQTSVPSHYHDNHDNSTFLHLPVTLLCPHQIEAEISNDAAQWSMYLMMANLIPLIILILLLGSRSDQVVVWQLFHGTFCVSNIYEIERKN